MKQHNLLQRSFLNAAGVIAYVSALAWFFVHAEGMFGSGKNALIPVFMLTLFVISAAITGSLVLGKPIMLFIEGAKREAVSMFIATIAWLVIFLVGLMMFLAR